MTQAQTGATFRKGRLLRSAAVSAFALSALAGGVVLSGGDAKALCASANKGQVNYSDTINGQIINFQDNLTMISCGQKAGTEVDLELTGFKWPQSQKKVDIDYNVPPNSTGLVGPFTDVISYSLKKTADVNPVWFDMASLSANIEGTGGGSVLKQIYSDAAMTDLIGQLFTTTGAFQTGPISGMYSTIYVKDTITANAGGSVDNVINDFRDVPGPLPILGAGAAFGFSRKLRGRIKAASNA